MRKSDIEALKKCVIFSDLNADQLSDILSANLEKICVYKKGKIIFSPASFEKCLAVILKGKAEVSKEKNSSFLYMNTLEAGNVFGLSCLFSEEKEFPTTVRAKEDCRVLLLDQKVISEIFTLYPSAIAKYINILSNKIHFLNKKIDSLSTPNAKTSIKNFFLSIAESTGNKEFTLPISISKLSEMLSIGRTSVYRSIDELIEEGFMKKDGKAIKIL